MLQPRRLLTLAACLAAAACLDTERAALFAPEALPVPAAIPGKGPRLSGENQRLYLTWMEPGDTHTTLKYASYSDGAWSEASSIADVEDMFVNWADMPSVVPLGAGRLAAHWLQKSADLTYAYDVVFVQSADGGTTWSEPMRPHTDGTPTEHGFVSMFAHGEGTGLLWLDGRKTVNDTTADPVASGMTLRAAAIAADGNVQQEQLVDELTCDCCQTDVAIASSGPVAVYRDRTADEIRDIYVTRYLDGGWRPGQRIGPDNWEIPGCPVNGPSIAAEGETVAVAWFTAADKRAVVKLSWSNDSGARFSDPIEIIDGSALGRVGVVLLDDGSAAVSWLQAGAESSRAVRIRRVSRDGALGPIHTVSEDAGAFAVPQLARSGDDLILVWTETDRAQGRIASARIPITGL